MHKSGSTLAMAVSGPPMHLRNSGAGQDFLLFDDAARGGGGEASSSVNPSNRPSYDTKPSFREYRATPSHSGQHNESPFSSPASKPEDDFNISDQGHGSDSYNGDRGSGTIAAHGTPKSKRQRGHGYSSSWTGGNLQQHRHQTQQPSGGGTLATAMDTSHSFGGYVPKVAGSIGSDTSPQINSLSLGDSSDGAGAMSSLFPGAEKDQSMQPNNGMMCLQSSFPVPPSGDFSFTSNTQQEQDQRAREQIRNELMGVDSRALKGSLRDIQQGTGQAVGPNMYGNIDFNAFQPSAFFPGGQNRSIMPPPGPTRQRSGSLDTSFLTSNAGYFNDNLDTSQNGWNGASSASNDINAFDLQGLDDYRYQRQQQQQQQLTPQQQSQRTSHQSHSLSPSNRPDIQERQFSTRTQQAIDRARAHKPTRKRMTRDGSGLTISPQDAFLDFPDIETLIHSSRSLSQGHYSNTQQNLFAPPPPPGIEDVIHSDLQVRTPKAAPYESGGQYNPPASLGMAHEGTPSLVDASSNSSNGSRATSIISSPLQRMPLNREDTVRPSKSQMSLLSQQGSNTSNIFSPAYSTTSSTDDEDEKPYEPNAQQSSRPGWQFPFPAQNKPPSASTSHQASHSGPRFSVVSSSSSESEDDDQRGRGGITTSNQSQGRRTMGGYGYMGSSQESGLNASTSSFNWQPVQGINQQQSNQQKQQRQPMQPSGSSPYSSPATNMHSAGKAKGPAGSDSQSQDDAPSLSPSIRSSAQAINQGNPIHANAPSHASTTNQARQRSRSRNRGQAANHSSPASAGNRRTSEAGTSTSEETSEWETGEESEADGSDYNDIKGGTPSEPKNTTRKRRRGGASTRQGGASHGTSSSGTHLTVCDYISPLTGESCRTEFHRPYDLARHRETIHAREEALLLKQGRITKPQCVVLYREVDPAKSLATVEWKCEGRNGCGSLFSRKDALLRHKRIRGH
jgi:hypothetical protein